MLADGVVVALDSNAVRAGMEDESAILAALAGREPCLPCVVLSEAVRGWMDLADRHNRRQNEGRLADALGRLSAFHEFTREMEILRYSPVAQRIYGSIRAGRGSRSRNDLRIAAICIAHRVPLLTRNLADFSDLTELTVETW